MENQERIKIFRNAISPVDCRRCFECIAGFIRREKKEEGITEGEEWRALRSPDCHLMSTVQLESNVHNRSS